MTKEQFINFKNEFKLAVEAVKHSDTHKKAYYNEGFVSQEEQNKAYEEEQNKYYSLMNQIKTQVKQPRSQYTYTIYGDSMFTHWSYYCAKHQLSKEQRLEYYKKMFDNLKECNQNRLRYNWLYEHNGFEYCEEILSAYGEEDIICFDR